MEKQYLDLLKPTAALQNEPALHRVFFVAGSPRIGKDLQEIFGGNRHFVIRPYENLVSSVLGERAL